MILRTVVLENFGLYRDRVVLDLAPRGRPGNPRPIVLVGGKNGAGKTTLLEAIRLALYGKRALGFKVSQEEYENHLRMRVHRPIDGSPAPTGASVGLTFDFAEEGVVRRYEVHRSWRARGRTAVESLVVMQDGTAMTDVPREEWHHFLEDLIPSGVSQLFFFDGEKIQEIATGEHDEGHLVTAIRGLLGIELVARLRTDLGLYLSRHSREGAEGSAGDLERVTRDLDVLDEQLRELGEAVAHLSTRRESEARSAEHARHRFVSEGGEFAARRGAIEMELRQVKDRLHKRQQELRDLANGHLAFAVAPRLTRPLLVALQEASDGVDDKTKRTLAKQLRNSINVWRGKTRLQGAPTRKAKWSREHWSDLLTFVKFWGRVSAVDLERNAGVSGSDRDSLFERLLEAEQTTRPRLESIANALDRALARQRELEGELLRADASTSNILLEELQVAEQRLGAAAATLELREEELAKLRGRRVTLEREQQQILDSQAQSNQQGRKSQLAARAIDALGTYEQQLLAKKLDTVRVEFLRCFLHLARKDDLVKDLRIDPATFAVTLIGSLGHEMPKAALSAGEKQIYATAMLWALARASGRPLPMLVDTPLARLDSDHRATLLTRYFPAASHQVILLSTDTEIDAEAAELLGSAVSHGMRLEFDVASGATRVENGFFTKESGTKKHALLEAARIG